MRGGFPDTPCLSTIGMSLTIEDDKEMDLGDAD